MDIQCGTYRAAVGLRVDAGKLAPRTGCFGSTSNYAGRCRNNNAMKQSSKRLVSVLFAFLFVVAAFVCFFDLVQPAYSGVEALRAQQIGEQNYLASETALVKQAQAAIAAYESESQGVSSVALAMPSGEDVAGALAQIQGIAANNGIVVSDIAVTPPAVQIQAGVRAAATSSSALMKPLESFSLKLTASGSYESLKNFLSEIETNIRIFDVQNLSVQPAAAPTTANGAKAAAPRDAFDYTLTIATYYQTQ
jgi:Tfp pilus assembly protein PilO